MGIRNNSSIKLTGRAAGTSRPIVAGSDIRRLPLSSNELLHRVLLQLVPVTEVGGGELLEWKSKDHPGRNWELERRDFLDFNKNLTELLAASPRTDGFGSYATEWNHYYTGTAKLATGEKLSMIFQSVKNRNKRKDIVGVQHNCFVSFNNAAGNEQLLNFSLLQELGQRLPDGFKPDHKLLRNVPAKISNLIVTREIRENPEYFPLVDAMFELFENPENGVKELEKLLV